MTAKPRVAQPYFVRNPRWLQMQRPRLKEFESGVVLRPLDLHGQAHDLLDLAQQPAQLDGLRIVHTGPGRARAGKRPPAVGAPDSVQGPAGYRVPQRCPRG